MGGVDFMGICCAALNSHLHVLRPGAPSRNKVQPTTVMKVLWDFAYMCQIHITGHLQAIYFGTFFMRWAFKIAIFLLTMKYKT